MIFSLVALYLFGQRRISQVGFLSWDHQFKVVVPNSELFFNLPPKSALVNPCNFLCVCGCLCLLIYYQTLVPFQHGRVQPLLRAASRSSSQTLLQLSTTMLTILLPKSFFDCQRPQPAQFGSKIVSMLLLFCDIRRRASKTTPGQTANFFSHILGVPSETLIWKKVVCDRVLFEFRMQALYVLCTQRSICLPLIYASPSPSQ